MGDALATGFLVVMGHIRWGKQAAEAQIHMATELVWQCAHMLSDESFDMWQ